MMKSYIFSLLLLLIPYVGYSQDNSPKTAQIDQLFLSMPDSITPLLTGVNKADMVDFLANKMKAEVTNRLAGKSELLLVTPDYLKIKMTSLSTLEIKLLPYHKGKIIAVVKSITSPIADSTIKFYNLDWTEKNTAKLMPSLPLRTFVADDVADKETVVKELEAYDVQFKSYTLELDSTDLLVKQNTVDYFSEDYKKRFEGKLKPSVSLRWSDTGYKL